MNISGPFKNKFLGSRYTVHRFNGNLITIEQTKKLLKNAGLSDEEAEKIRDEYRMLAEVIFDKWVQERKTLVPSHKT